jgi:rubrerythrin
MGLQIASVIYCFLVAALFLGLWLYTPRRDHARFEGERRRTTFRCLRCNHLYVLRGEVEEGTCPKCSQSNSRLKF